MSLQDISDQSLQIVLNFRDKDAPSATDHPIPSVFLPADAQQLLTTPVSKMFDDFWNGTKDAQGKTLADRAVDQVAAKIRANRPDATNIGGGFPVRGTLQAEAFEPQTVAGIRRSVLVLNYALSQAKFTFNTGLAAWRITFETDLRITVFVPELPGPFTAQGSSIVSRADISPDNLAASAAVALGTIDSLLSSEPLALFQAAEGAIDSVSPAGLGPLGDLLHRLDAPFRDAVTQGFLKLAPTVDGDGVRLHLTHPVDAGPVVTDATKPSAPSLFHPTLALDQSQVAAGGQLVATGKFFPFGQATSLHVQWADSISGRIESSEVAVDSPGQPPRMIPVPRVPFDTANSVVIPDVTPNASFTVRVRDCDRLTCSDFSAPVTFRTTGTDGVDVTLLSGNGGVPVGQSRLSADGGFSATVTIPPGTAAGFHTLRAAAGGQSADASITVLGTHADRVPRIAVIDPNTGLAVPSAEEQTKTTLRGEGFEAGSVALTTETGQSLGTAAVPASGLFVVTFVWPSNGKLGQRQIIARQTAGGTTLQATAPVFVQQLPH